MNKTKVLIMVDEGNIQFVGVNNMDIEVTVLDWDNIKQGDEPKENEYPIDNMTDDEITKEVKDAHIDWDKYYKKNES